MVKISLAAALLLAVCDAVSLTKFPDVDTLEDGLNKADTLEDGLTKAVENVEKIDWSVVQAFSDSVEDADQATKEDISDWLVSICEEHNIKEVHGEALVAFVGKQFGMEGIKDVTDLSAKLTTDYGVSQEEFNDTVKQCFAPRKEDHASEADADATEAEASEADAVHADADHASADDSEHDDDDDTATEEA